MTTRVTSRRTSFVASRAPEEQQRQRQRALAGTDFDEAVPVLRRDRLDDAAQDPCIVQEMLAEALARNVRALRMWLSVHLALSACTGEVALSSSSSQSRNSCTDGLRACCGG